MMSGVVGSGEIATIKSKLVVSCNSVISGVLGSGEIAISSVGVVGSGDIAICKFGADMSISVAAVGTAIGIGVFALICLVIVILEVDLIFVGRDIVVTTLLFVSMSVFMS